MKILATAMSIVLTAGLSCGASADEQPARALYDSVCRACHSPENVMVSSPKAGDRVEWARRLRKGFEEVTRNAIDGFGAMPPKGGCAQCTPEQIQRAIEFMAAEKAEHPERD